VNLLVALGTYALLYAHTGDLALPVGVHFGVNYVARALFGPGTDGAPLVTVTESFEGLAASVSGGHLPQILVAYLLLRVWLRWRDGDVSIRTDVAEWTGR
jgi:membrane protease YdiL (CAAX protease family)